MPELTRLGYTLKHVPNLFWLVIEDAEETTPLVTKLLQKLNIPYAHLVGNYEHDFYVYGVINVNFIFYKC